MSGGDGALRLLSAKWCGRGPEGYGVRSGVGLILWGLRCGVLGAVGGDQRLITQRPLVQIQPPDVNPRLVGAAYAVAATAPLIRKADGPMPMIGVDPRSLSRLVFPRHFSGRFSQ